MDDTHDHLANGGLKIPREHRPNTLPNAQLVIALLIGLLVAWCQLGAEFYLQQQRPLPSNSVRYSLGFEVWLWPHIKHIPDPPANKPVPPTKRADHATSNPDPLSNTPDPAANKPEVPTSNLNKPTPPSCNPEIPDPPVVKPIKTPDPRYTGQTYQSHVRRYRSGAVAADSDVCSRIGTDILARQNGSAGDAAIAAMLCVGVVNMHSASIGGGSITVAYDRARKEVMALDSLPVAPRNATQDMFTQDVIYAQRGSLAIGVPGEMAGLWRLHQRLGRLPWEDLFTPTIKVCEEGFTIEGALGRALNNIKPQLYMYPHLHTLVTNGTMLNKLKAGDTMKRPVYAQTLRRLAASGGQDFYHGSVADDIVADLADIGSIITKADLQTYRVKERSPLRSSVAGYDVYTPDAPSGGPVVHNLLDTLKGFPPADVSDKGHLDATSIHRMAEAMKFAFAKRTHLADPDYVDMDEIVENLMTSGHQTRQQITDHTTHDSSYYGTNVTTQLNHGTTHLSVLDAQGNAVAITSSINIWFGSYILGRRTGILFNAAMDDFAIPGFVNHYNMSSAEANYVAPGKRPLSSMTPLVALDQTGDVKLVSGAAGGPQIITALSTLLLRLLGRNDNLEQAMNTPRFHHQLQPDRLGVEWFTHTDVMSSLHAKGHQVYTYNPRSSVVQSVLRNQTYLYAVSDARKGGFCDGY